MIRSGKTISVLVLLLLIETMPVWGLSSGYDFLSMRSVSDGGRYFSLWDTRNLSQKDFVLGSQLAYIYKPLRITQSGARVRGVIEHGFLQEFSGAVGLVDRWLAVGMTLPVAWSLDFLDPNVVAPTVTRDIAVGDMRLTLKTQLVDPMPRRWGLAVVPFLTIPLGSGDRFMGSKGPTGGAILASELQLHTRWSWVANVGIEAVPKYQLRNANKRIQLLAGLGSHVQFASAVTGVVEAVTTGRASGLYQEAVESPVEIRAGLQFRMAHTGLTAHVGGGAGIVKGAGAPSVRAFAGISYSSRRRRAGHRAKALAYLNTKAAIMFDVDKWIERAESAEVLKTVATHIRQGRLRDIRIKGYADGTGAGMPGIARYNLDLSRKRAVRAQTLLLLESLPDGFRINTLGHGYHNRDDGGPGHRCALHERCVVFETRD